MNYFPIPYDNGRPYSLYSDENITPFGAVNMSHIDIIDIIDISFPCDVCKTNISLKKLAQNADQNRRIESIEFHCENCNKKANMQYVEPKINYWLNDNNNENE